MATIDGPSLLAGSVPDGSGKAWDEPFDILATNDVWKGLVRRVDEDINNNAQVSTRVGFARGFIRIPGDYVGAPVIKIIWGTSKTTGDVVFDGDFRAIGGDNAESLDQTGTQESVTVTDSAGSAAWNRMVATLTLTAGNYAPGDLLEFELFRDGTDAADTLAGAAVIFEVYLQYADA